MNFGEAMSAGLKRSFQVSGRATRSEYWYFFLFALMLTGILAADWRYFTAALARGAPEIVNLQRQIELRQITESLSTVPYLIGVLAMLAVSALFLLGTSASLLVLIVPLLTLQARRLHDTGRSGWWAINANLAWMAGIGILALGAQQDKAAIALAAAVISIGFFAVPMTMLFLLAQPGDLDRNKFDHDRPQTGRRNAPPPLSTDPSLPPEATPAE